MRVHCMRMQAQTEGIVIIVLKVTEGGSPCSVYVRIRTYVVSAVYVRTVSGQSVMYYVECRVSMSTRSSTSVTWSSAGPRAGQNIPE